MTGKASGRPGGRRSTSGKPRRPKSQMYRRPSQPTPAPRHFQFLHSSVKILVGLLSTIVAGVSTFALLPRRALIIVGLLFAISWTVWALSKHSSVRSAERRTFHALNTVALACSAAFIEWGALPTTPAAVSKARGETCASVSNVSDSLGAFLHASDQRPGFPKFSGPLWEAVRSDMKTVTERANNSDSEVLSDQASTMRRSFEAVGVESFPNRNGEHPWIDGLSALSDLSDSCEKLGHPIPGHDSDGTLPPPASDSELCREAEGISAFISRIVDKGRPGNEIERWDLIKKAAQLEIHAIASDTQIAHDALSLGQAFDGGSLSPKGDLTAAEEARIKLWKSCRAAGFSTDLGIHQGPKGPSDTLP